MQCDFWMRLNVKSISYMHDSIQHNKTMHAKIVFQDFDSFKGEGDHSDLDRFSASKASGSGKLTNSDHPGHSETLTTPTTRKNWSGTMNCVEKIVLNNNFQKQKLFVKTICKVWKKNHPVCLQEIVRKDKSYNLQKGCPEEWFTKLQNLAATKIFKWLIRNDPFRDFLIMLFDINSLHLPFPKLVCIKFWINHI